MMASLIGWSTRFRLLVLVVAAGLVLLGATQLRKMPVDTVPEYSPTYVELQTEALGLSPEEVEQLITVPLEGDLLNGVPGIETIRSQSVASLSSIVMVFEPGTDLLQARQLVAERLTLARALPFLSLSKPPTMVQPVGSTSRVMMVGLRSDQLSLLDLSLLARWTIRPRLLGIPGVANVAVWGQREQQLQVQVDPAKLRRHDVTLNQVLRTAGNAQVVSPLTFLEASHPGSTGFLDTPNQRLQIRHVLPIANPEGLAQVPVEGVPGGRTVLGDVATVKTDHQPLIGDAVVAGGQGLLLVVEKLPGANTLQVTRDVESALQELAPGLQNVAIDTSAFRPASTIERVIDDLRIVLVAAAALIALAFLAFIFQWRAVVVALVSIAMSLIVAALVLDWRGETMNALTLAGLIVALGVVVDDAVLGVEPWWRGRRTRAAGVAPAEDGDAADADARRTTVYAACILLLVVAPVFFLGGMYGSLFRPLVLSYGLALIASLLTACTVTPALASLLLPEHRSVVDETVRTSRSSPVAGRVVRGHDALLGRAVRRPLPVLVGFAVVVVAAAAAIPQFTSSLLPSFKERDLLIRFDGAPGTSNPEMNRIAARVGEELRAIPGVHQVSAQVGRAVLADQVSGINSSRLWVSLDPDADYQRTVRAVREVAGGVPGLRGTTVSYSQQRLDDVEDLYAQKGADITPRGRAAEGTMVVRLYGKDFQVMAGKAAEVERAIAAIPGVHATTVERQPTEPAIEVKIDLAAAERYGITPGDIRRDAALLVSGLVVGSLFEEQKVFDVLVVGTPEAHRSLSDIRKLPITTPRNGRIPLSSVADVSVKPMLQTIEREGVSRRIDIAASIGGRDRGAIAADVEKALRPISFPQEYRAVVLAGSSQWATVQTWAIGLALTSLLGIFLLLQAAFGSWRLALVVLVTVPLALSGALIAAVIDSRTFSLGTMAGLLAVLGIALRHAMLLVTAYRTLGQGRETAVDADLVLRGARARVAPVLLSVSAVALAMLPLIVPGADPVDGLLAPLAITVLGGLVSTTAFAVLVLPLLYLHLAPRTVAPRDELGLEPSYHPAGAPAASGD
jgi:Cu/Ag efflux pump CusA